MSDAQEYVSVVIVTTTDGEALPRCLASLARHTRVAHELILVLNESVARTDVPGPAHKVIRTGRNPGFSRAANRGLEVAGGDYILLLQADTCLGGDVLGEMLAFMRAHPRAGVAGVQQVAADGRLQPSDDVIPDSLDPLHVPSVNNACLLIRRSLIESIGYLDEGFSRYLETADFCKRAVTHGFEVWHLPGVRLTHLPDCSAAAPGLCHAVEYARAGFRFCQKHAGPGRIAVLWLLSVGRLALQTLGSLPCGFLPRPRVRLKQAAGLLAWHLLGMPAGWGLDQARASFRIIRCHDLVWFVTGSGGIPAELADPNNFLEKRHKKILKNARPTFVITCELNGVQSYFKRYNYRGLRDAIRNILWHSRARHSFEIAQRLIQLELKTPEAFLACERRHGWFLGESYLATRAIAASDLFHLVQTRGYTDALIVKTARYVRRLHDLGVLHVDLKGRNIMLGEDGEFYLIDLDRCRIKRMLGLEIRAKNLSYLNGSFHTLPPEKRLLFLGEYVKGDSRLERRKAWLARRIAVHTAKRNFKRYKNRHAAAPDRSMARDQTGTPSA